MDPEADEHGEPDESEPEAHGGKKPAVEAGGDTDDEGPTEGADNDEKEPAEGADTDDEGPTVIRAGRKFEQEYRLEPEEAGEFLVAVGERLRDGEALTIADDDWTLPFAFGGPVELEVEFDGVGEPELEIELELPGRTDETAPRVE